jgi:hypothetical protein
VITITKDEIYYYQFFACIIGGLILPMGIAYFRWKKYPNNPRPKFQAALLILSSILGMIFLSLPFIKLGQEFYGNSPGATAGTTLGGVAIWFLYNPVMKRLNAWANVKTDPKDETQLKKFF